MLLAAGSAQAAEFEAAGLLFSDELGGFRLLSVTGEGSREDPIVIVEEITGDGPALLTITSQRPQDPTRSPSNFLDFLNISVVKVVINGSGRDWGVFDIELREEPDTPSDYSDGLSFGQMYGSKRHIEADRFEGWRQLDEPRDHVTFFGGEVLQGEAARFSFLITDPTPAIRFYLLQEPSVLLSLKTPGDQPQSANRP